MRRINDRALPEPIPFQMGLQVPCCTMLYSCPNGGGEPSSVRHADIWDRFSMGWRGKKECQILEGHLMPDHVHMCIAIPPKHPVASVIGFLKGKSAIATRSAGG